jgi:homoserine O-succinyltransferase
MSCFVGVNRANSAAAVRPLDVAFINNLPDTMLGKIERQFSRLIGRAAGNQILRWQSYRLTSAAGEGMGNRPAIAQTRGGNNIRLQRPDLIVVTGAEPTTEELSDEPFWRPFVKLLDWADESRTPVLLSCLAAHGAVLHFDGIQRVPLAQKRFGLFEHELLPSRFTEDVAPRRLFVAHSRCNEITESALISGGYQPLTRSPEAGVDMFVKQRNSLFLFCQGHPEYEPETLLGEYRRDTSRFLRCERPTYPEMPRGCFDGAATSVATAFRRRAEASRDARLADVFPYEFLAHHLDRSWYLTASDIVARWLHRALVAQLGVNA